MLNNKEAVLAALPEILAEVKEVNLKWQINPDGTPKVRTQDTDARGVLLIMSELMEVFEGVRRNGKMDDHLPQYPAEAVEMADLFIRAIDRIVYTDDDGTIMEKFLSIIEDGPDIGHDDSKITHLSALAMIITNIFEEPETVIIIPLAVIDYCDTFGIDLMEVYRAKMDYNKTRSDHKPEARMAKGGKQF